MTTLRVLLAAVVTAAVCAGAAFGTGSPASGPTVVMTGLDNPRGLTFVRLHDDDDDDDDGAGRRDRLRGWALYVAEAGRGGGPGPHCITLPRGEPACPGSTGAISRLADGVQRRVVTGLPSYAFPDGSDATGPHDVSFGSSGKGTATIGLGADPALRAALGPGLGRTIVFRPDGRWAFDVDVAAYEQSANPDGGPIDSNPYGLLEGAGDRYVVEAGGNALLGIRRGRIRTVATFPSRPQGRPTDAVPTAVAAGKHGELYVGELTGVPFAAGSARVYRVSPFGGQPRIHAEGFTTILDLDVDRRGNLYVLEHSAGPVFFGGTGTLWRVGRDGTRSAVAAGLQRPTSVALGPDGAAYVSNRGNQAGTGEVLRVPVPDAGDEDDDHDDDDDDDDD